MRILLLGAASLALSGCSFLGLGHSKDYNNYNAQTGYYGQQAATHKRHNGCGTGNCLARWNVEGGLGTDFNVGGTAVAAFADEAAGTSINKISMREAYDPAIRGELGGSYALSPNRKVTGTLHYAEADSDGVKDWGTIGGDALTGALSDYKSYGAELGLRQYFAPRNLGGFIGNVRPYVEGRAGATKVSDINIQGASLGGAALPELAFYDGGIVPTAAGLIGVETPIARYMTMGIETGIRYTGGLDGDNSVLPAALQGTNDGASRTSIPLMVRGRYRF